MAATTVALSVFAVSNARFHAALTEEFGSANAGSWNVERINGLIYGRYGRGFEICRLPGQGYGSDQRRDRRLAAQRPHSDALAFSNLAVRLNDYQDSLYKLAPIAKQSGTLGRS